MSAGQAFGKHAVAPAQSLELDLMLGIIPARSGPLVDDTANDRPATAPSICVWHAAIRNNSEKSREARQRVLATSLGAWSPWRRRAKVGRLSELPRQRLCRLGPTKRTACAATGAGWTSPHHWRRPEPLRLDRQWSARSIAAASASLANRHQARCPAAGIHTWRNHAGMRSRRELRRGEHHCLPAPLATGDLLCPPGTHIVTAS